MDKPSPTSDLFQANRDRAAFDFYMETKHVSLARGTHKIQRLGI
jgi:hypothetical protein